MKVPLRWSGPLRALTLGVITGDAELAVVDTGPRSAIDLVHALIVDSQPPEPDLARPGDAASLAVADRDRVLAALHTQLYGDRIEATLDCPSCHSQFDLGFSLAELVRHCEPDEDAPGPNVGDGWNVSGVEFRPLTGADEIAAIEGAGIGDLVDRAIIAHPDDVDHRHDESAAPRPDDDIRASLSAVLERATPLISSTLSAQCFECASTQTARFDVQTYLLSRLQDERASLLQSVHLIASEYHWTRSEILSLGRDERQHYASMISDTRRAAVRR